MDDLKELYFRIENPIDDKDKWHTMLNTYSTSKSFEDFYTKITRVEKPSVCYYNEDDKNNLSLMMWSFWKRALLSLKDEEIEELIDKKQLSFNVYDVIDKISTLDSIKSTNELKNVLSFPLISNYFSIMYKDDNHDLTIYSNIDLKKKNNFDIALTVRISAVSLYKFLKSYINECTNNEIPYYIKFNEKGKSIIVNIYSQIENLKKNISILNTLKKENYTFFEENNHNVLVGNINNWITINQNQGFNNNQYLRNRSQILFKSFDSIIYNYVTSHLNTLVSYKDGRMNLESYIANYVMEKITAELLTNNIKNDKEYFSLVNSSDFIKFKDYVKSKLLFAMKEILDKKLYLKDGNEKIQFKLNENKSIDIEINTFMTAIRTLILTLMYKDSYIERSIKVRIKNECQFYKVDPLKFSLDISFSNKLLFDINKYRTYEKELGIINSEIAKFDNLEKLMNSNNDENRNKIRDSMIDLLELS